ncbi:hypothetical protein P7K49_017820 [Saguinus oedipus]|uniref:Apoptotic chromatin condensation inducer in the nucleus n=1 Tax=Saguinus oedipus TaxID=9490 RepID=A0ABQ9V3L3_SAGOE|nr:hypothetical protein P7K49_017820 [Saguinus oedipus]
MPTSRWERDPDGMGQRVRWVKPGSLCSTSEKAQEEPPAKLLDDLFRKTKAAPCIYWLPLTDSQIVQKEAERAERAKEREKRRKEQEEEEQKEREKEAERERNRQLEREKQGPGERERKGEGQGGPRSG